MNAAEARRKAYELAAIGLRQYIERGGLDEQAPIIETLGGEHWTHDRVMMYEACELVTEELLHWARKK